MTLLAGAAEADITPPFPIDLLGYVRRPLAARSAYEPLMATACIFRDDESGATVVVIAADVVGLTTPMADRIRARVGELVGCDPAAVLLNSSHSHAAPWPGATIKLGGEFDDWTETELRYWDTIPDRYASVALEAVGRLAPARVSGGVGQAVGLAVNRRERTADGRTILGWNREGGQRRLGRGDPGRWPRRRPVSFPLLPLPSVADLERELAERRSDLVARSDRGETRLTMNPIRYHISWLEAMLAQEAAGGRATAIDGEIWAARIGDCAIVGAPGEIFGAIGTAVRRQSPAPVTIFAGYSQGTLGYVATPDEYPFGGYEPSVSHRGYGQPAPFSPEVAGIIERTAVELLEELFVLRP
jgi:hypothetical protein